MVIRVPTGVLTGAKAETVSPERSRSLGVPGTEFRLYSNPFIANSWARTAVWGSGVNRSTTSWEAATS